MQLNKISILDISGNKSFLTGLQGKKMFSKFLELIFSASEPTLLFLDFSGTTASGSFFREAVLKLRNYCVESRLNLYPIVANANEDTLDELSRLFEFTPDALFVCIINELNQVSNIRLVGNLEEKQEVTLELVQREKEVDAPTLSKKYIEDGIGTTGWNNRLSSLANKGLIIEKKKGRSKIYTPVMEVS